MSKELPKKIDVQSVCKFHGDVYPVVVKKISVDKDFFGEITFETEESFETIDREVQCAVILDPIPSNRKLRDIVNRYESRQTSIDTIDDYLAEANRVVEKYKSNSDKLGSVAFAGRITKYSSGRNDSITVSIPSSKIVEILSRPNLALQAALVVTAV